MKDKLILLVEDDEDDRAFFLEAMAKIDTSITVKTAATGEETLRLLHDAPTLPYAMFLDINLPGMSGLKLLKSIKAVPKFNMVPAIMLTSSFTSNEINTAMETGADAYIIKPDNLVELQRFVEGALSNISEISQVL